MTSIRTYAGVSLISLGLVAIGFYGGERHVSAAGTPSYSVSRFEKLTETTALDTKTGQVCDTHVVEGPEENLPKGMSIYTGHPKCTDLAKL